jgi:DNA ligase-1
LFAEKSIYRSFYGAADVRFGGRVARLLPLLQQLDRPGKLVAIKLITGAFRVGVSKLLVTRTLAEVSGLEAADIAQRFMGYTAASPPIGRPARASVSMPCGASRSRFH